MLDFSNNPFLKTRSAGILLPLSSMRGQTDWGCGDMAAFKEWLSYFSTYDVKILQILPIWETAPNINCPYSALSAYAIDPLYISIADIPEVQKSDKAQELIKTFQKNIDLWRSSVRVQFNYIKPAKYQVLWAAYEYFIEEEQDKHTARWQDFLSFEQKNASWLVPYSIFRTAKDLYKWHTWKEWPTPLKEVSVPYIKEFVAQNSTQIMFFSFIQWLLQGQLEEVRALAKEKHIALFGDIPFGVNFDSADVWSNQSKYLLDAEVGAPKDKLAEGGQKWGLPAYNWATIEAQNFNFWRPRIKRACDIYDIFRLDHLVGFFRTWIFRPGDNVGGYDLPDETAQKARGAKFIEAVTETAGPNLPVGEDLGMIPDYMREYMRQINMPGYRVIRWEKDNEVFREPHQYPKASLATTSTHDISTLKQWWGEMPTWQRANFWEMVSAKKTDGSLLFDEEIRTAILKRVLDSNSSLAVFPLQDIIGVEDRINVPGTVDERNWSYRVVADPSDFDKKYSKEMHTFQTLIKETNRV